MIKFSFQTISRASVPQLRHMNLLSQVAKCFSQLNAKERMQKEKTQFHLSLYMSQNDLQSNIAAYESDDEDEYSIMQMGDMKRLIQLYRDPVKRFRVNELIKILDRAYQLVPSGEELERNKRRYANSFNMIISRVKWALKESATDYPMIGSFSHFLKQYNYLEDMELWLIISDYLSSQRMIRSKNEIMKCCVSFTALKRYLTPLEMQHLYLLLEEDIVARRLHYDLNTKFRILSSFFEVEMIPERLMSYWQPSILAKIPQEHDLFAIISILELFVTSNLEFGADLLEIFEYKVKEVCEEALSHKEQTTGRILASCISIFNFGQIKHPNYQFNEELISEIARLIQDDSLHLDFGDYVKILRSIDFLANMVPGFEIVPIFEKGYKVAPESIELIDVPNFADCIQEKLDEGKQGEISKYVDESLAKVSPKFEMQSIFKTLDELYNTRLIRYFPQFLTAVPARAVANISRIEFEDMCHLYFIIEKEKKMLDWSVEKLDENLEIMRDYIKRCHSNTDWSPAGRVDIKSNFYKLLEIVDINEFYLDRRRLNKYNQ